VTARGTMARVRRGASNRRRAVALVAFPAVIVLAFGGTALVMQQTAPAMSPPPPATASAPPIAAAAAASAVDSASAAASAATARPPGPIKCTAPAPSARLGGARTPTFCVPVLEYHRIVPSAQAGDSLPGLVVPPETFAAQMGILKASGWHTITLSELAGDMNAGKVPPAHTFVVTIDDGWSDGYRYALPILKADRFVATYFVVSSRIGQTDFLSASELKALIVAGDEIGNHTVDHVDLIYLSPAAIRYEVDTASSRIAAATGVRPRSFAYPDGGVDSAALAAVAACPGLQIAVAESRTIGASYPDRYDVPRLEIGPEVSPGTLLVVLGG
jgi:peptidoglycan/xylan/chitin deacetylase (PgdA/CDA1 family)